MIHILTLAKTLIVKILNFKLVILLEHQNTKTFLLKDIRQTGLQRIFEIKKVKDTVPWTYVTNDLNGEEIMGTFNEKESQ